MIDSIGQTTISTVLLPGHLIATDKAMRISECVVVINIPGCFEDSPDGKYKC